MPHIVLVATQTREAEELRSLLCRLDHAVTVVEGGFYALTRLERSLPDLLVVWADTGDLPGEELCSIARGDPAMETVRMVLLHAGGPEDPDLPGVSRVPASSTPLEIADAVQRVLGLDAPSSPEPSPEVSPGPPSTTSAPRQRGFAGGLDMIQVTTLVQTLSHGARTGCLHIAFNEGEGSLYFWGGRLIHAKLGVLSGELAFEEMIADAEESAAATFRFDPFDIQTILEVPQTISAKLDVMLLEADAHLRHRRGMRDEE